MKRRHLVLLVTFVMTGCQADSTTSLTSSDGQTHAERVQFSKRLIGASAAIPGKVVDAHYLEVQHGDGRLGPADVEFFARIEIDPAERSEWEQALVRRTGDSPMADRPPPGGRAWWPRAEDLAGLAVYEPRPLFFRLHGWVVISREGRYLFVYTFTT